MFESPSSYISLTIVIASLKVTLDTAGSGLFYKSLPIHTAAQMFHKFLFTSLKPIFQPIQVSV